MVVVAATHCSITPPIRYSSTPLLHYSNAPFLLSPRALATPMVVQAKPRTTVRDVRVRFRIRRAAFAEK